MSEFWDWAVTTYAKPGVAEASLDLQDKYGQSVPLLLWAAWAGVLDPVVTDEAVTAAWAWLAVIEPLRGVRRRLKTEISAGDETDRLDLRIAVKTLELEAEKALMGRLEALVVHGDPTAGRQAVAKVVAAWRNDCPPEALDVWFALL
ncbi:MAG TPA: TIGR02444 family protein [Asticcacaulis sp.]|nr:TIGR02444 family protein [Asticcacaulis sp.]